MNKYLRYFLTLVFFFVTFYLLDLASLQVTIFPFAFGCMVALIWSNQKVWIVCPAYLFATMATNFTFEGILSSFVAVLMIAVPYYVHVLLKKNMRRWELPIYAVIGQTAYVVFTALSGAWLVCILHVGVGVLFMYACLQIFEAIIVRGFTYKLTSGELIAGAFVLMAIVDGLASFDFFGFSFLKLIVPLILLCVSHTCKGFIAPLLAGIMGFGTLLGNGNPLYVAPFILWALAITAFRTKQRIFPVLAMFAAEAVCGFYFSLYYSYTWLDALPVLLSGAVFMVIPAKLLDQISTLLSSSADRLGMKNIVNRNRQVLSRRLGNLSEVFCEMDSVFRKLIKQNMNSQQVKDMLFEEIRGEICKGCPEYKHCHRTFSNESKKMFEELIQIAMEKGKITLLDIPSYLTSRCAKTNSLISAINTLTAQYKNYSSLVESVDSSKLLVADQLSGISQILKGLAGEVDLLVSFDSVREGKIIDELAYANIICTDAVVYERDARTMMASLIVRSEDADREKLRQVVSKICGQRMMPYETYPASRAGLVTVNLKTAPRYDCVFGLACHNKSGSAVSGDCHSVQRLDGDRFMFALCDGMGSGEAANQKSDTAVSLIENFYKAGFDNEIILSSVNRLLNLEKNDVFSTIDICVVDLRSGIADFVKMGATSSYVRTTDECKIVTGGALPIGVLNDVSALTNKLVVGEKDMIVLCSDGISDSFGSDEAFKEFILTIKTANPQEFAEEILSRALAGNNGYAVDDMTCLVVKVFQE